MKYLVKYDSNNSGGDWWLTDEDWAALERAGWTVVWGHPAFCRSEWNEEGSVVPDTCKPADCPGHRQSSSYGEALTKKRWLGALATSATLIVEAASESLAEEAARVIWSGDLSFKYDGYELGCNCCGRPHSFWATAA